MALHTGTLLGHYEILAPIGAGGMGEVYRARDSRLGREVAIKVLPANVSRNPDALSRFEREAQALASLSHPNILTLFDFGSDHGIDFAVMELLEGETLRSRLDASAIPYERAVDIALPVAEGLEAAHSKGVIHRDLKPDNIFLTRDGRVKILDFGLVRWNRTVPPEELTSFPTGPLDTRTGMVMGTVHYMSPEQVRGKDIDERTDIFSFGAVLYEIIYGSRPFSAETLPETMVAILKQDPADLTSTRSVPTDMERLIRTCLEKDPQNRFQSARDLCIALKMLVSGSIVSGVFPEQQKRSRRKKTIDSIAVLPFANTGSDPDTDYLSDGITETIINTLSQLPKLRVMARSTVFRYKGKDFDPRTIGRDLGVRAVLTGRLVHRNEGLNVQAELVNADDGSQLWGEQYEQQYCDLQEVQQKIAQQISEKLKLRLLGEEKKRIAKVYTRNTMAYRFFLQGRFFWNKRTEEGMLKGIELFEKAIQEDPAFALAYVGLADSYMTLGGFYYHEPRKAYEKSKVAALKALEIDKTLGEAYISLATLKERYDWDWVGADENFRRGIKLNPGYPIGHQWYGVFLTMMGRFEEAIVELDTALDMDPLSVTVNWTRGYTLYYTRQYERAIVQLAKTLELDPTFNRARYDRALICYLNGEIDEARAEVERWRIAAGPTANPALVAYAHIIQGETHKASEALAEIETGRTSHYVSSFGKAIVKIALGDLESAMQALQRSFEDHEDPMISLLVNPRLDPLRSDPRFSELVRRVKL